MADYSNSNPRGVTPQSTYRITPEMRRRHKGNVPYQQELSPRITMDIRGASNVDEAISRAAGMDAPFTVAYHNLRVWFMDRGQLMPSDAARRLRREYDSAHDL